MKKPFSMIMVASLVLVLLSPMTAIAKKHGPKHRPGLPRALLPLLPTAVANAVPDNVLLNESVEFSSRGSFHPLSGESLTFSWDFGDGSTSSDENPAHAYSEPGTYIAVLRVVDSRGFVDADTVVIRVTEPSEPLTVEASASPSPCAPVPCQVQFQATATGGVPPYTFSWNFGDGNTDSSPSPTHTYHDFSPPEGYTATVTVTDVSGDTASTSLQVEVF